MKYRIVKETGIITKRIRYYLEKKKKFLLWYWWSPLRYFDSPQQSIIYYTSLPKVERERDKLIEEKILKYL